MNVEDLIAALSTLPPDATVVASCCVDGGTAHPILSLSAHLTDHVLLLADDFEDVAIR